MYALKVCSLNVIEELRSHKISKTMKSKLFNFENFESIEDSVSFKQHTSVVVILLLCASAISLLVDDLGIIFAIIGSFSESTTNFILPGIFLILTETRMKKSDKK